VPVNEWLIADIMCAACLIVKSAWIVYVYLYKHDCQAESKSFICAVWGGNWANVMWNTYAHCASTIHCLLSEDPPYSTIQ